MLLLDKLIGPFVPIRFVAFALVGSIGVLVHLIFVIFLFKGLHLSFSSSQILGTLIAMSTNFALNNLFTYRDIRLNGWRWFRGWAAFIIACALGTLANIAVSVHLFENGVMWVVAALVGITVGAVWNYATTGVYTWGVGKR